MSKTEVAAPAAKKTKSYKFGKDIIVPIQGKRDGSSCGFLLKGYKLRWVSASVQTNNPGRIWAPLRISDLDPEFVSEWQIQYNHLRCGQDSNVIRRVEMVLYYASEEAAKEQQKIVKREQAVQESGIKTSNRNKKSGLVSDVVEEQVQVAPPEGI